jgi:hypothetical protein
VLSVAAPAIEAVPGLQTADRRLAGRVAFWTASYRAASDHLDQIAVMSYAPQAENIRSGPPSARSGSTGRAPSHDLPPD